ncbi:uncharacterized protein BT62DRAFT_997250 [Guyanagaster necrorhizus]|uniref:Uncharacterized protein n=1 Tax=Guyanagaster necrorhizus TaxID=856835 RepID=A0A9P7VJ67_9AGAR|nr:uncharacterized protein BT62DRAFT_997250 [Guyanagaster necrorhizus MCA 3950]KAG7441330.1 hypothetical protein BT62DRAFT_997250 [Guyanagaster necrorhizus MCA 3950]
MFVSIISSPSVPLASGDVMSSAMEWTVSTLLTNELRTMRHRFITSQDDINRIAAQMDVGVWGTSGGKDIECTQPIQRSNGTTKPDKSPLVEVRIEAVTWRTVAGPGLREAEGYSFSDSVPPMFILSRAFSSIHPTAFRSFTSKAWGCRILRNVASIGFGMAVKRFPGAQEARAMELVRNETAIPVPPCYRFTDSVSPHDLAMALIEGQTVASVWDKLGL